MSIIVRIQGGLGNQLFQYAFGRGVASRLQTGLLIDRTTLDSPKYDPHKIHRGYSLSHFNIKVRFAKDSDLFGFIWMRKHYKTFDRLYRSVRFKRVILPFYYPEQTFAFDRKVFSAGKNTYFDGYWQTEKYFKHIGDEIRQELTLTKAFSAGSQEISDRIRKTNAISLHVRRGDYISDQTAAAYHGICSPAYYRNAVAYIAAHVISPHFFIFSDDYEWSVQHFKSLPYAVTCVPGSAHTDFEDVALMSQCKHHIIANSSLGWWGAWLNPSTEKITIAPKQWFANVPKGDTRDLRPENWIKL